MATQTTVVKDSGSNGAISARKDDPVILDSQGGRTIVMESVVAKIAGLAVREVPGVHNLVPYGAGQAITSFARNIRGSDMRELGVHVEVGTIEAAVDVRIVAEYGACIPDIATSIRENVTARVGEMTGLRVKEINIEVVDLYFDEPERVSVATGRDLK